MLQEIPLKRALELAAGEKSSERPRVKVTFRPLKRGGKFRAQLRCAGKSYLIGGKEGLLSKTRLEAIENMILAQVRDRPLREKPVKEPYYRPPSSSGQRFGYSYGYGY